MSESDSSKDIERRVLDAAARLFSHYGYDKTTMNDIAREAGVAKSTIYVRWNRKEDLFMSLVLHEGKRYTEDWFARVEADPEGGTYGNFMRHALEAFFSNPFLKAFYGRDRRLLGTMIQRLGAENLFVQRIAFFRSFFKAMQDAGVVRKDIEGDVLTYAMNAWHYGLLQFGDVVPSDYSPPLDKIMSVMMQMIEAYVTPEDGVDSQAGKQVIQRFKAQVMAVYDRLEQETSSP